MKRNNASPLFISPKKNDRPWCMKTERSDCPLDENAIHGKTSRWYRSRCMEVTEICVTIYTHCGLVWKLLHPADASYIVLYQQKCFNKLKCMLTYLIYLTLYFIIRSFNWRQTIPNRLVHIARICRQLLQK